MTHRQECILITLKSIGDFFHKNYSFPPIKRIQELLLEYHGLKACRRSIYRDMKWLDGNGFLGRQCRHFRKPNGVLVLRTTLYWLKRKAYRHFESLAYWLKKHIHRFAVTKKSLDKQPLKRVMSVDGWFYDHLKGWIQENRRLKPSEAIL